MRERLCDPRINRKRGGEARFDAIRWKRGNDFGDGGDERRFVRDRKEKRRERG